MRLGAIEIAPLLDTVGVFGKLEELYPAAPAADWEPYRDLYPDLFEGEKWRFRNTSYLIRSAGRTILVDTGLGEYDLLEQTELAGGLLPALAEQGLTPDEIETVLLSHVHVDHVGWNTQFDNARFAMHPRAVAAARERVDRPHIAQEVVPLIDAGRVDVIEDGSELAPEVVALALEGHDPGHTGLRLGSEGILIVDAAVHPALFDCGDWSFANDDEPERAAATRRALAEEVLDEDIVVICGHYPGSGIGRLAADPDGRAVWREI